MSDSVATPETIVRTRPKKSEKTRRQPPYHVILHNDNDHSFDYVIHMMQTLFGHTVEKGFLIANEVHTKGRVIVDTTSKERAELKRDQIHAFGADPSLPRCKGSMSASIEPAE
jgi:ATP-dependent Clp protease adaptor protein ClpS